MAKKTTKQTAKSASKNYFEKVEKELETNQSKVSMVLGALIILVIGILIFNFFNKPKSDLGPAQQTQTVQTEKYTVKEGDTLFTIAQNQLGDGEKFTEIAQVNKLSNPDQIEVGQILEMPKIEAQAQTSLGEGTGGGNTTIWGPRIEGDKYTVEEGDWLSTIAGRAYGDVMAFDKIAKANEITDPNVIEPGTILTIPR